MYKNAFFLILIIGVFTIFIFIILNNKALDENNNNFENLKAQNFENSEKHKVDKDKPNDEIDIHQSFVNGDVKKEHETIVEDYFEQQVKEDFIIKNTETGENIALDVKFSEFITASEPVVIENNYVGEIMNDQHLYKYYMYKFKDFDLYVSNVKYNEKNRSFDDYYVSQITLTTDRYETSKGIKVGMKYEDVKKLYANVDEIFFNENIALKFHEDEYELMFVFSEDHKIELIVLSISVS